MAASSLHQVGSGNMGSGNVRRLGTVLRERAWLIILCMALGGAAAYAYLTYAPKQYATTTTLELATSLTRFLSIASDQPPDTREEIGSMKRQLQQPEFIQKVVEGQELNLHSRFSGGLVGAEAVEHAAKQLDGQVLIETPPDGSLIYITVTDRSPDLAARLANAFVTTLMKHYSEQRATMFEGVLKELRDQLQRMEQELSRLNLSTTPEPDGLPGALQERRSTLQSEWTERGAELTELEVQIVKLRDQLQQVAANDGNPLDALRVPLIADHPDVAKAHKNLLAAQVALEEVQQRYREKHRTYIAAKAAVDSAQAELAQVIQNAIKVSQEDLTRREQLRNSLKQQIEQILADLDALPADTTPTAANASATSEQAVLVRLWEEVLGRIKQIEFGQTSLLPPLTQARPAAVPTQPLGLLPPYIITLGLASGLLAGLLLSLVFGYGDTSLKTVDEIEQMLGLPVLSVIPRLKDNDSEMAAAEGFRSLRTSISVSSKEKEPRLIQFTSTSPDEGKTFCALNFAVGLAQQGKKTVLIECDLRRPMAAPSLTLVKVDAAGVSDYLKSSAKPTPTPSSSQKPEDPAALSFSEIRKKKTEQPNPEIPLAAKSGSAGGGGLSVEDVVQQTEVANLYFVAAGKPVSSPTELLAREAFEDLLNSLLQRYDNVVLDSAPVLGVSETLLIASRMQGVCFVIRGSQTPRRAVQRAVEILRRADAPILGAVLNGITPSRSDPYGQDYYYHRTTGA